MRIESLQPKFHDDKNIDIRQELVLKASKALLQNERSVKELYQNDTQAVSKPDTLFLLYF